MKEKILTFICRPIVGLIVIYLVFGALMVIPAFLLSHIYAPLFYIAYPITTLIYGGLVTMFFYQQGERHGMFFLTETSKKSTIKNIEALRKFIAEERANIQFTPQSKNAEKIGEMESLIRQYKEKIEKLKGDIYSG